jgi:hypothetical protein
MIIEEIKDNIKKPIINLVIDVIIFCDNWEIIKIYILFKCSYLANTDTCQLLCGSINWLMYNNNYFVQRKIK